MSMPPLRTLIAQAARWVPMGLGVYRAELPHAMYSVPADAWKQIHQSMPKAMVHMAEKIRRNVGYAAIEGARLRCQLAYYDNPQRIPTVAGKDFYWLGEIQAIGAVTDEGMQLLVRNYLMRDTYPGAQLDSKRKTAPWVAHYGDQLLEVPKPWLEERYPGWENRLASALSINCTQHELVAAVCTVMPAVPAADLSDFAFD